MSESNKEIKESSRRKLLKTVLAGGGAVAGVQATSEWIKPVVRNTVLPAHAQSSLNPLSGSGFFDTSLPGFTGEKQFVDSESSILDSLIQEAHAQDGILTGYCERAPERGSGWFRVMVLAREFDDCFRGFLWDTHVQITTETENGLASEFFPVLDPEECGGTLGGDPFALALDGLDDANAPTMGSIWLTIIGNEGEALGFPIFPGGSPLSLNCVNACTSSSSSFSSSSSLNLGS